MYKKIQELEKELSLLKRNEFIKKEKERKEKEKLFKKENEGLEVYGSDDYCGASIGDYSFYFGYEVTVCKKHPKCDDCEDEYDCEEREWAFQVSKGDEDIMTIPASKLGSNRDIYCDLIAGIMIFINENMK